MKLSDLNIGEAGKILSIGEKGPVRRRLMDMGVTPGTMVKVVKVAPLGDPVEVNIRGYELTLRKSHADAIEIEK